jgi:uncharacterized HAD superfamily protein
MKRKIAIDVDDVLADFHTTLLNWHNETYGTFLKTEDVKSYFFNQIWGGTIEEAIKKVNDFHNSVYSKKIPPIIYSVSSIDILSKENELFVVTSRPSFLEKETEVWLDKFFQNKFSRIFHSSNHYSKAENSGKSKLEICRELNAYALIDDSLDYIKQCTSTNIKGILFGDYPWNRYNGSDKIVAKNWNEVLEKLI